MPFAYIPPQSRAEQHRLAMEFLIERSAIIDKPGPDIFSAALLRLSRIPSTYAPCGLPWRAEKEGGR